MPKVSLTAYIQGIEAGQLGSFPTDTVPALASRPEQGERIYAAKGRSLDKPLILMGATLDALLPYVVGSATEITVWRRVTEQFWPGALTLVLPASDRLPPAMNPQKTGTIGIRVPDNALARGLLAKTGPLATTSINRSGQPPLRTRTEIATQFPQVLLLSDEALAELSGEVSAEVAIVPTESGVPSTVAAWTGSGWQVLRQGGIQLSPKTGIKVT